jgi:hypothetical protein
MIQSLLIANRGEIARPIIRTAKILPGTGRGTASWRWRGPKLVIRQSRWSLGTPLSLRATPPQRGGF